MIATNNEIRPGLIAYLDQVTASAPGRAYKQQVLELLELQPGQCVVDIGCGPGTDLAAMNAGVAPTGSVVGIDRDPAMVAEARARVVELPRTEVHLGEAHALPLKDRTVDRARTDRMLQHVADPSQVLAEFRRVSRPGGRIVMAEPDWEGLLIDSLQPAMSRGLSRFICAEIVRNARIGRSLPRLCRDAGLDVQSVVAVAPVIDDFTTADQLFGLRRNVTRAVAAGYLDAAAEEWIEDVSSRPFLATALLFLVVAERPA
ncbi:methyltransferase domain-containing protein [Nonomuraea harbinensis]|uniref:Methyltransferase domain-containing protein n=1 Tax=Nonomuraea harbinensis TaxID=1286938 RepID=A0ABW1BKZ3_9ACTN|nr:methyltransferase domain-containing protein [Nonomuraea harbinensis]